VKKFISFISVAAFVLSCKDEYTICDLPTTVRMNCRFYQHAGGVQTVTAVPFLTVTKLSSGSPDYSLPLVSEFSLALNPVADSVQYEISVKNPSIPDTVTFVYTTQKINLSAICGDIYTHKLTMVHTTLNTLDSVRIFNNTINTTPVENVRIYF